MEGLHGGYPRMRLLNALFYFVPSVLGLLIPSVPDISGQSFLTSPILEAMRKADQVEKDESGNESTKALLLVPIVEISRDLELVSVCLTAPKASSMAQAGRLLQQPKMSSLKMLKATFNRYSDNIFYEDARQANVYLGGGTTPNTLQTQQYLYRNAVLSSLANLRQDVAELEALSEGELQTRVEDLSDAVSDLREVQTALSSYLKLADPEALSTASAIVYDRQDENSRK